MRKVRESIIISWEINKKKKIIKKKKNVENGWMMWPLNRSLTIINAILQLLYIQALKRCYSIANQHNLSLFNLYVLEF